MIVRVHIRWERKSDDAASKARSKEDEDRIIVLFCIMYVILSILAAQEICTLL